MWKKCLAIALFHQHQASTHINLEQSVAVFMGATPHLTLPTGRKHKDQVSTFKGKHFLKLKRNILNISAMCIFGVRVYSFHYDGITRGMHYELLYWYINKEKRVHFLREIIGMTCKKMIFVLLLLLGYNTKHKGPPPPFIVWQQRCNMIVACNFISSLPQLTFIILVLLRLILRILSLTCKSDYSYIKIIIIIIVPVFLVQFLSKSVSMDWQSCCTKKWDECDCMTLEELFFIYT